jgi:hypothetical protein
MNHDYKNLDRWISENDYEQASHDGWPSYRQFLEGTTSPDQETHDKIVRWIDHKSTDQNSKKFPIKTATACQSKWTWSTIYLNISSTASCHRVYPVKFDVKDFDNFHNHPKKLKDRQLMLEGKWPRGGCEYCRDIEMSGGWSDRQHNLTIGGLAPPELDEDPTAISVTPRLVEIFAQNTCNLMCTYCNGNLSSKIEQENKKFGKFSKSGVVIESFDTPVTTQEMFDKFINWVDGNILNLRRLHLLGGETFLQVDLMDKILEIIERRPNPFLQLNIFSNLNVPDKLWNTYTQRIKDLQASKHIRFFDLTASIDCWGDEAEYARFGLDLKKFEDRFAWAAQEDPNWIRLNVNQTVTCLTMHTMPELIEKINKYTSERREIGHYFQFYTGPQMFQHPKIYAYEFWQPDFERIFKTMRSDNQMQKSALQRMEGMRQFMSTFQEYRWTEIEKLHVLLDEFDRRRGTDWRSVFPYLNVSDPSKK